MLWTNNELGPHCFCGNPTVVKTETFGEGPMLLCLFHTSEEGALFNLPDERPEWWPNPPTREVFHDFMQPANRPEKDGERHTIVTHNPVNDDYQQ